MPDIASLIAQGSSNLWLFIPSAILLGALHGLEPGHSKTMMAAFIVAIRGTVAQAMLLGLAATISHTAVVWLVALVGMHLGGKYSAETTEPYFQLVSGILIIGMALWMVWRTWRSQKAFKASLDHDHGHSHDEPRIIDTGHGIVSLEVFEDGVPPRFRLHNQSRGALEGYDTITIETTRPSGVRQTFSFIKQKGYWESEQEIPEPHEFTARLTLDHGGHAHDYDVEFAEHDHGHAETAGLDVTSPDYQDAHELAHANDIRRRFANQHVTTGQIIVFGLTGGLIPCPASITVLLICLQLKKVAMGAILVLSFSIGLALTLMTVGAVAAYSMNRVGKRWSGFSEFARKAPYFSGVLIGLVGLYVIYHGLIALP